MLQEHDKRQDPVSQLGDILTFKTVPQPPLDARSITHLASRVIAGSPEDPQAALLASDSMCPGVPYVTHPLSSTWQKWRHTHSAHANKAKVMDLSPTHPAAYLIIHPPTHPPISPSIHPSIQRYTNLPIHPSIHSSIYQISITSLFLSIYPPIYPSIYPPIHASISPPIYPSISPPIHPSISPPIHPSISPPIIYLAILPPTYSRILPTLLGSLRSETRCSIIFLISSIPQDGILQAQT